MSTNAFLWQGGSLARMPLGVNHIYPNVTLVGSLESSGLVNGDRQLTTSPNNLWEVVSGAWKIRQATRSDKTSLPVSDVITGALGFVGTTGFLYTGSSWARTPIDIKYHYSAASYAALPTDDKVEENDCAKVTAGSVIGNLLYLSSTWTWQYVEADLVGNLPSSNVSNGAIGKVGTLFYTYSSPSWTEISSAGDEVIWNLTDVDVIPVGAEEGNYGIYNSKVFRLKNVTINAAAGGGTQMIWLPPEVYSGSPEVYSYIVGTETLPALPGNIQGWSLAVSNGSGNTGTLTTNSGELRLQAVVNYSGTSSIAMTSTTSIIGTQKFYLRNKIKYSGTQTNQDLCGISIAGNQFQMGQWLSNNFVITNTSWTSPSPLPYVDKTFKLSTSGNFHLLEITSGSAISELIRIHIDGKMYSSVTRNYLGATNGSTGAMTIQAYSSTSAGARNADVRIKNNWLIFY